MKDTDVVTGVLLRSELKDALDTFGMQLFKYFDKRFKTIDKRLEHQDTKIDNLTGLVDSLTKDVEIYYHESLASDNQVDRHDRWIKQLADGSGTTLEY